MGKRRQFNEQAVLEKMANHFWKHGYSATKVDQLSQLTGLTKTSLYNAFGNKEALFLNSINFYVGKSIEKMVDSLDKELSLSENLEKSLKSTFETIDRTTLSYGCFLTNSIIELNANEPALHNEATKLCDKVRQVKHGLFFFYVNDKRLSSEYTADELTDHYMTLWQGLRVQSRNNEADIKLSNSINTFLKFIRSIEKN